MSPGRVAGALRRLGHGLWLAVPFVLVAVLIGAALVVVFNEREPEAASSPSASLPTPVLSARRVPAAVDHAGRGAAAAMPHWPASWPGFPGPTV